jgi:hypothetical protein
MTEKVPPSELSDNSLDKVRELLIGRDDKFVQEKLNRDAKGIVTNVVSEALFERETKDGSVNKVLVPLVEKSLHRSTPPPRPPLKVGLQPPRSPAKNPPGPSRFKLGFHFPAGKFQTDPSRKVSTNIRPSAKRPPAKN